MITLILAHLVVIFLVALLLYGLYKRNEGAIVFTIVIGIMFFAWVAVFSVLKVVEFWGKI